MRRAISDTIDDAEAFARLVAGSPVDVARIKSVVAARPQVWCGLRLLKSGRNYAGIYRGFSGLNHR